MEFSKTFIQYCEDLRIDLKQYEGTKEMLRRKLEDILDNCKAQMDSCIGIELLSEDNNAVHTIPMRLNNRLYKAKALYNEFMDLVTK